MGREVTFAALLVICWAVTVDPAPDAPPTNVRVIYKNESHAYVAWDGAHSDCESDGKTYNAYVSTINAPWCGRLFDNHMLKQYHVEFEMVNRCTYYVVVRVCTSDGCGPFSPPLSILPTQRVPVDSPTYVGTNQVTDRVLVLLWRPIPAVRTTGYIIAFETVLTDGTISVVLNNTDMHQAYISNMYPTTFMGLAPNTEYTVSGRAYTEAGPGPFSAAQAVRTLPAVVG